jgi:hypothetical protein
VAAIWRRVALDPGGTLVWFGNNEIDHGTLLAYDASTWALLGTLDYAGPGASDIFPLPSGLIAIRTSGVYLVQSEALQRVP